MAKKVYNNNIINVELTRSGRMYSIIICRDLCLNCLKKISNVVVQSVLAPEIFRRRGFVPRRRGGAIFFFMVRHGRPNFCQFSPTNV